VAFWETIVANAVGALGAIAGGLLAARYQLAHQAEKARDDRRLEREEEALFALDDLCAAAQLRIARSFGESEYWVPPIRHIRDPETWLVTDDDPQNPVDHEAIRDALHAIERAWTDRLATRIRSAAVRQESLRLREQTSRYGQVADVRTQAKHIMAILHDLRSAIGGLSRCDCSAGGRGTVGAAVDVR
jgi:hypothetical protein